MMRVVWLCILSLSQLHFGDAQLNRVNADRLLFKSSVSQPDVDLNKKENLESRLNDGNVKKVHIVFMNHLDVGYDGIFPTVGFINNVINKYFTEYFPRASLLAEQLRKGGYQETFIYTTHPWLVQLYMNCPQHLKLANVTLKCPSSTEKSNFANAVANGYINWHAGPMNMQIEFLTPSLLKYGLNISQNLDKYFKINRPFRVLSQRDVPGMTQSIIPYLIQMGIEGVSVGVNSMTAPPAVPKLFRWQYGGKEVLATWHPGGYPNNAGKDPAHPGGLSVKDCVVAPAPVSQALCFAFRTDNSGPPTSIQEIIGYYEILRSEFPGASLVASTLENFMQTIVPIKSLLPLVTQELGDTWIQGISSDPRKAADYRAVARVLGACLDAGKCSMDDPRMQNASMFLLKPAEHTWGLNSVSDIAHWTNSELKQFRNTGKFMNCSLSWQEQREFIAVAISALKDHPVVSDVKEELSSLAAKFPDLEGYSMSTSSAIGQCGSLSDIAIGLDGSITSLKYKQTVWASQEHPLGKLIYQTFDENDFKEFGKLYNYNGASAGYVKLNITASAHPQSRRWPFRRTAMYVKGGCDVWVHIETIEQRPWQWYGAPTDVWINYNFTQQQQPVMEMDVRLFDKTSTRLPEAIYLAFSPAACNHWRLMKLGSPVDPLNVFLNGSQYQHAIDFSGVNCDEGISINSPDVPLVCPITDHVSTPRVFPAPLQPIKSNITGMAFNFYNNIWDTNYIYWYPYLDEDKDFKARFSVRFA